MLKNESLSIKVSPTGVINVEWVNQSEEVDKLIAY